MIAPVEHLISAVETLLVTGFNDPPAIMPPESGINVYRNDAPTEARTPLCMIYQAGPAKERHKQGLGMWEIPMGVKYIHSRCGDLGQTAEEIADDIRAITEDLEAVLSLPLRLEANGPEDQFSTPEQRLTTEQIHVWDVYGVELEQDSEMNGDPSVTINFTALCAPAALIIPEA